MLFSLLMIIACGPGEDLRPVGPPIQTQLIVHVDPLVRGPAQPCENANLKQCGALMGPAFMRRSRNLEWLLGRWQKRGRTLDLQLGPEMALAWAGDESTLSGLSSTLDQGEAERVADSARKAIAQALDSGTATLGVHAHNQMPDADGLWGDLDVEAAADPCGDAVDPAGSYETATAGIDAVRVLAERLEAPVVSFGSHLPRTLEGRNSVASEAGLEALGAGGSECFTHVHDHPIFERFGSGTGGPIDVGEGLPVAPGVRVVGSMAPHLGVAQDGSLEASRRRLIQLLLNWRNAALSGEGERSWFFGFHAHLFDLMEGEPSPHRAADRGRSATEGQRFRGELDGLATTLDEFTGLDGFMGARSAGGGLVEWVTVPELAVPGEDNPAEYGVYPYLPVPAMLEGSHLVCTATSHGVWMAGFERCEAGWIWGEEPGGYSCTDGEEPSWIGVIVPESEGCKPIPLAGTFGWPLDATEPDQARYPLHADYECWGGLFVPMAGLLVETDERSLLPSFCMNG